MKLNLATSIPQLTLIGFSIVVVPLIVALVSTVVQVDALSAQIKSAVLNAAQAVQSSRIVMAQVFALERSAGQFMVLKDRAVLARYEDQRGPLAKAVEVLSSLRLAKGTRERLNELVERERALHATLNREAQSKTGTKTKDNKKTREALDALPNLAELVQPMPFEISQMIAKESDHLSREVNRVQGLLLMQAISLIPLALVMAITFSVLITRPLKRLSGAIRRLGGGQFSQTIEVTGPRDIRELSERLEWLRNRLNELEQQKLMFLRHVSHELKTPLTAVREGVELLSDEVVGRLNTEQAEVASILVDNTKQLQAQIENLLKFNIALTEGSQSARAPVRLSGLVEHVIDNHKLVLRSRNIRVDRALSEVVINGDREQLRALFDNLLSNAIKYSPDGGQVEVSVRADDRHVLIDVADEGPGIDASDRTRVFEAFYQGKSVPKGHVKGTGLGLAISERYARLHHGRIEILDVPRGAHLRVTFPLQVEQHD